MSDALTDAARPIDLGELSEVPESQPLSDGEHDFTVSSAKEVEMDTKNGPANVLQIVLVPVNDPDADPVFDRIFLPKDTDTEDQRRQAARRLNRVRAVFNLGSKFVPSDLVGKSANLKVKGKMYQGERVVNVVWPKAG